MMRFLSMALVLLPLALSHAWGNALVQQQVAFQASMDSAASTHNTGILSDGKFSVIFERLLKSTPENAENIGDLTDVGVALIKTAPGQLYSASRRFGPFKSETLPAGLIATFSYSGMNPAAFELVFTSTKPLFGIKNPHIAGDQNGVVITGSKDLDGKPEPVRLVFSSFSLVKNSYTAMADGRHSGWGTPEFEAKAVEKYKICNPLTPRTTTEYSGPKCYWMENRTKRHCWVDTPIRATTVKRCKALDSCNGGGRQSGGGCYKWANCPDCPRAAW